MTQLKHCPHCGADKPLDQFHVNRKAKDGHQCYCKVCAIAINSTEHVKARVRAHMRYRYATDPVYRAKVKERVKIYNAQRYRDDPVFRAQRQAYSIKYNACKRAAGRGRIAL